MNTIYSPGDDSLGSVNIETNLMFILLQTHKFHNSFAHAY